MRGRAGRGRGGKGGAEPRARIRLREVQVLDRYLAGETQHQIAAGLGISQPAVSKILRRLEDRLLADVAWKVERHRARQTLRLEALLGEALRAWKASQQDRLRRRQRKHEGGAAGHALAELVSESQHGDPRYLEEARKVLADLRGVWGVDAPTRVALDARPFAEWSDADVAAEVARTRPILEAVGVTVPPAAAVPRGGRA